MYVYSIINFKGGTGKSTVVENLGYALAQAGRHTLVIDADRQGNSSLTLLGERMTPTLTQVLKGEVPLPQAIRQARPNLFVVPAGGDLDTASSYIVGRRSAYTFLRKILRLLESTYDIVLIDHAGAYTPVMETCLLASQAMLIPCELESYSVQGLFSMFEKLQETLEDHELENKGIIPYNVDMRYKMHRQYFDELREAFGSLVTVPIRTDANVPKAQSVQMTIFEYAVAEGIHSRAAEDFQELALDLLEEIEDDTVEVRVP